MEYGLVIDGAVPRSPEHRVALLLGFVEGAIKTDSWSVGPNSRDKLLARLAELEAVRQSNSEEWRFWLELADEVLKLGNPVQPGWKLVRGHRPGDVLVLDTPTAEAEGAR